jgi:hypothetical protein
VKGNKEDGSDSYVVRGTIVVVFYTGEGLCVLIAVDADASYRDNPKGRKLVQVHWSRIIEVEPENWKQGG